MREPAPFPDPIRAREGRWDDRLVDLAVRGAIGAALALPYKRRLAVFGAFARRVGGPLAGYRARALRNLAMVRPDWPEAARRRIADEVLDNLGRTVIENYGWRDLRDRLRGVVPTGGGLGLLEEARATGRPVVLLTGHFGNHAVPVHALTLRGHLVGALYRPMSNPFVNRHYAETMRDLSGPSFPKGGRGNLGFVRHLAGGGIGMILFDLHDQGGVPIPFLGRAALTATTAADLALRFDALLVPAWGIRQADGLGWEVAIEEPIPHGPPLAMMEEATRRLEARVRAHPGQWFWVHRRWKGVPEAQGPTVAAARIVPGPGS